MNSEVLDKEQFTEHQRKEILIFLNANMYNPNFKTMCNANIANHLDMDLGVFNELANNSNWSIDDDIERLMIRDTVISSKDCVKHKTLFMQINNTKERRAEKQLINNKKIEFDITYKNNISGDELNENNHDINNGVTIRSGPTSSE